MSSFEKCLFRTIVYFCYEIPFLLLNCICLSCILDINFLPDVELANIFSHSAGCFFTLWMVSSAMQKLFTLVKSHLLIFALNLFLPHDLDQTFIILDYIISLM